MSGVAIAPRFLVKRTSITRRLGVRLASLGIDFVYLVLATLIVPWLGYLVLFRKRGVGSLAERLGFLPISPSSGRIWFHAVSVGELEAALPLIELLGKRAPQYEVVISTTTTTAQEIAHRKCPHHKVFLFPIDLGFCVRRALRRIRPSLLVLMELEIWPNLILNAHHRGIPVLVANGRISERGFESMYRFRKFLAPFMKRICRYLVQNDEYRTRLRRLGVSSSRISIAGNLKFDRAPLENESEIRSAFEKQWGFPPDSPRWIAGCTHPGEEEQILRVHCLLRERIQGLSLILAPRHVERSDQVVRLAEDLELQVSRSGCESSEVPRRESPDVVVLDEVGELHRLYACADVAFVGGSLVPRGGHNILEPIVAGTPVLHGPYTGNFRDMVALFTDGKVSEEVTSETLEPTIEEWFRDPALREDRARRGLEILRQHRGVADRTLREVLSLAVS